MPGVSSMKAAPGLAAWQHTLGRVLLFDMSFDEVSHWPERAHQAVSLYRELMHYPVVETLISLFPYCGRFFAAAEWDALIGRYRSRYPNRSYQLYRCGEQFPRFLRETFPEHPFLSALADYEWEEVLLLNASDVAAPAGFTPITDWLDTDWLHGRPYWNPVSKVLTLPFSIDALLTQLEATPEGERPEIDIPLQPTRVLQYRHPESDRIRFFELNDLTADVIRFQHGTFQDLFQQCLAVHRNPGLLPDCIGLLQTCREHGMLFGYISASSI